MEQGAHGRPLLPASSPAKASYLLAEHAVPLMAMRVGSRFWVEPTMMPPTLALEAPFGMRSCHSCAQQSWAPSCSAQGNQPQRPVHVTAALASPCHFCFSAVASAHAGHDGGRPTAFRSHHMLLTGSCPLLLAGLGGDREQGG